MLSTRKSFCVVTLLALSLYLELAPQFMLDRINPSVKKLSEHVSTYSGQKTIDTIDSNSNEVKKPDEKIKEEGGH